jgi:hypothetical protein
MLMAVLETVLHMSLISELVINTLMSLHSLDNKEYSLEFNSLTNDRYVWSAYTAG